MKLTLDARQFDRLTRGMAQYRNALPRSVTSRALAKAAKPMLRAAKAEVPVGGRKASGKVRLSKSGKTSDYDRGGATRRDLRIKAVTPANNESTRVIVGVSKKRGRVGWRTHFITKGTRNMRANDFLQRAYDATINEVAGDFGNQMQTEFDKWVDKNLPKGTTY